MSFCFVYICNNAKLGKKYHYIINTFRINRSDRSIVNVLIVLYLSKLKLYYVIRAALYVIKAII